MKRKIAACRPRAKVDQHVEEQFVTGRLYGMRERGREGGREGEREREREREREVMCHILLCSLYIIKTRTSSRWMDIYQRAKMLGIKEGKIEETIKFCIIIHVV